MTSISLPLWSTTRVRKPGRAGLNALRRTGACGD